MSRLPLTQYKNKSYWAGLFLTIFALTTLAQDAPLAQTDANTHPVAAEVNGVKILRKEVDYLYSRQPAPPNLPAEVVLARKRAILSELVRAEVLAQRAATNKLDQSPDFELEMALAKRSMLAGKVEQQILGSAQRITAQQALDFVNANPRLFAERQLLTLEVMNLSTPDEKLLVRLDQASNDGSSFEKMERLVREAKGNSQRRVLQTTSETLPAELQNALTSKPFKTAVIKFDDDKQRGMVMLVRSATPAPLTGNEAVNVAGQLLQRRQLQATRVNSINAFVNAAKVNYFGVYQGVESGGQTSLDAELLGSSIYSAPISRSQKIAIAAGVAAASTLLVLLLMTSWRYWTGNSHRSDAPDWLQRIPLLNQLVPPQPAGEALAQALAAASPKLENTGAAWHGKLLVLLCLVGCLALIWLQSVEALSRLPQWVMALAGAAGLAFGLALAWVWRHSKLAQLGQDRRWLPVPILGLLTAGALATGMILR